MFFQLAVACALLLALFFPSSADPQAAVSFPSPGDEVDVLGEAGPALQLAECIGLALESNDRLAQERLGLEELYAQVAQVRAGAMPRFDLKSNWFRGRDPAFALDETFAGGGDVGGSGGFVLSPGAIPAQSFWRSSVESYWEIRPTRVLRAVRAAKQALEKQRSGVEDMEHRTVESVVTAYYRVLLAQEEVAALEIEAAARLELLKIARRRFLLDLDAPLDTLQAAVSLANLSPDRARRAADFRSAGRELNILMGRDAVEALRLVVRHEVERDPVEAEQILASLMQRPDLRQLESETDLLRTRRGVRSAENHPYFTLEGAYGYVGREFNTQLEEDQDFWRASVTLVWPLWDGNIARGQRREISASIRRSEFAERDLRVHARSELFDSMDAVDVARRNLDAASLNMRMAEDAHAQVSLRYELGKSSFVDVLNSQSARFVARSNLVQARFDVLRSTATLKRAMGYSPVVTLSEILASSNRQEP